LRQRYTIDLARTISQIATIEVTAESLTEAQDKARAMAVRPNFPWVDESPLLYSEQGRVTKVICHAGEVPDEPVEPDRWKANPSPNRIINEPEI
jgi:hypothetical protein